jgi:hypothetical protein
MAPGVDARNLQRFCLRDLGDGCSVREIFQARLITRRSASISIRAPVRKASSGTSGKAIWSGRRMGARPSTR